MSIYYIQICNALLEKDPKRRSDNFRKERKEQVSGLDSVSDIPDSLSLILSRSQRPRVRPLLAREIENSTMYVIYKNTCIFYSSNFHRACNSK